QLQCIWSIAVTNCAALTGHSAVSGSSGQGRKLADGHRAAGPSGVHIIRHEPLQNSHVRRSHTIRSDSQVLIRARRKQHGVADQTGQHPAGAGRTHQQLVQLGYDLFWGFQANAVGIYPGVSAAGASVRRQNRGDASLVDQTGPPWVAAAVQCSFSAKNIGSLTCGNSLAGGQREASMHGLAQLFDVVAVANCVHSEVDADIDQTHVSFGYVLSPTALPFGSAGEVADLKVSTACPLWVIGIYRHK